MANEPTKSEKGLALFQRLTEGAATGGGSTPPPAQFLEYTFEHLFGTVWQDDTLALEERSLLTCAVLVALNREAEQRVHFVGAKNLGVSRAKVEAMITHTAHYAGWPCAASAFRVLGEVWPEETSQ